MQMHPAVQFPLCSIREAAHFDDSGSEDLTSPDLLNQKPGPFSASYLESCGRKRILRSWGYSRLGQMHHELRSSESYHLAHGAKCSCKIFKEKEL